MVFLAGKQDKLKNMHYLSVMDYFGGEYLA